MKHSISLIIVIITAYNLTGCGKNRDDTNSNSKESSAGMITLKEWMESDVQITSRNVARIKNDLIQLQNGHLKELGYTVAFNLICRNQKIRLTENNPDLKPSEIDILLIKKNHDLYSSLQRVYSTRHRIINDAIAKGLQIELNAEFEQQNAPNNDLQKSGSL